MANGGHKLIEKLKENYTGKAPHILQPKQENKNAVKGM